MDIGVIEDVFAFLAKFWGHFEEYFFFDYLLDFLFSFEILVVSGFLEEDGGVV